MHSVTLVQKKWFVWKKGEAKCGNGSGCHVYLNVIFADYLMRTSTLRCILKRVIF